MLHVLYATLIAAAAIIVGLVLSSHGIYVLEMGRVSYTVDPARLLPHIEAWLRKPITALEVWELLAILFGKGLLCLVVLGIVRK